MIELKRHGSYLATDSDGFVVSQSHKSLIQEKWKPVINATIDFYKAKLDEELHSVYIRGSVSKGMAVDDLSDLDSFCVLREGVSSPDDLKTKDFQKVIKEKYHFCDFVEISFIEYQKVFEAPKERERSIIEELIKTQAVCVYGDDLASKIKPFRISEMIGHSLFVEKELEKLPEYFEEARDSESEIKDLCSWIMKRIIRSGFDLVLEREQKFTRDLYLCFESFSKYYPDKSNEMKEVLNLCLNPISDVKKINQTLSRIGPFLLSQIESRPNYTLF